jgi:hypothetical protein
MNRGRRVLLREDARGLGLEKGRSGEAVTGGGGNGRMGRAVARGEGERGPVFIVTLALVKKGDGARCSPWYWPSAGARTAGALPSDWRSVARTWPVRRGRGGAAGRTPRRLEARACGEGAPWLACGLGRGAAWTPRAVGARARRAARARCDVAVQGAMPLIYFAGALFE